jgi:hypothetical protein
MLYNRRVAMPPPVERAWYQREDGLDFRGM